MDNYQASNEIILKECAVNTEEIVRIGEVIESDYITILRLSVMSSTASPLWARW